MLSNKMTFSLTCLLVLLAFGLGVYTPSVMADGNTHDFTVTITAAETMIDVSSDDGMQVASGRDRASRALTANTDREATLITLLITTQEIVNLGDPDAAITGADLTGRSEADIATAVDERAAAVFDDGDIKIDAYDAVGRSLGILPLEETADVVILSHRDAGNPGKEFLARIDETKLTDAYSAARAGGAPFEIHTLLFSIPAAAMQQADIAHVTAVRNDGHEVHVNGVGKVFRVDLVDDDEGDPEYNSGVSANRITAEGGDTGVLGSGTPGVVTIDQLRERAGFIETGPFDVRIILTEEPTGGLTTDLINVKNGSASAVTKGATLKGAHPEIAAADPQPIRPARASELTWQMASYTLMNGNALDATTAATGLPEATGRDNMYHQYFATITPNPGHNGTVTISLNQFSDKVLPVPNRYVPLSDQEIAATTLTDAQATVRDARVANESLMIMVNSSADPNVQAATDAYAARQTVLDGVVNETVLTNKTYIPQDGYLVLVADRAAAGIADPGATTKSKANNPAAQLYNVHGLGLQLLAANLDDFFRNGGTLNLAYADISEATNSEHGDSKGPTGDDATGYTAADSTAYAAGDLIFNEIMWGLDAGGTGSQYIELYNASGKAIGIDNKEWVITVGAPPTGFTVIDSVSNADDPATAANEYWKPKGNGGVTAVSATHPAVMDLVSMSRIPDTVDGTAAASWADSMAPSANLSGRRIGTPGAANVYVKPTLPPATPPATPPAKAPVASVGDLMITEIMVDTGSSGNLPQWIEISNVSGAAVSLMGWSLNVDNDPSDAVVLPSLNIQLGDVEVGVGAKGEAQSVLVISKESNRNSGVGTGNTDAAAGMIRSERIINAGLDPHAFLSKMSFRIGLVPPAPQASGAVGRGDVAGNLQQGWELPMAEGNARSSLIRRDMNAKGEVMGTDAAGWVLASTTSHVAIVPYETYYGDAKDQGSPGIYKAGSALPVELSKFGAKRDPLTGQVVITWETQSELNNAGFFIKRSQQKNTQFVAVNPAMIPGAGTTSEKQSYTYTDTTAKPNIVYYYQIEDVSLDGNRQTLTRAHRLKGHIGAAGKLTTLWGQLKDRE